MENLVMISMSTCIVKGIDSQNKLINSHNRFAICEYSWKSIFDTSTKGDIFTDHITIKPPDMRTLSIGDTH